MEEQLQQLSTLGIEFADGMGVENLLESWDRAAFEEEPYSLLLLTMGGTIEREPWTRISNNVWHFDTEAIEGEGSYVAIAQEIVGLTDGDLPLTGLRDFIDFDRGEAWLEFTLDGDQHRWEVAVEDDWVDPAVFDRFFQLLETRQSDRRLMIGDLGGQDILLVYLTPDDGRTLERLSGIPFGW